MSLDQSAGLNENGPCRLKGSVMIGDVAFWRKCVTGREL